MTTLARLSSLALGLSLATPALAGSTPRDPVPGADCASSGFRCLTSAEVSALPVGVQSTSTTPPTHIKQDAGTFDPGDRTTWARADRATYANVTAGLVGEDVNDTRRFSGPFDLLHVDVNGVYHLYVYTQKSGASYVYTLAVTDVGRGVTAGALHDIDADGDKDIVAGYSWAFGGYGAFYVWEDAEGGERAYSDWDAQVKGSATYDQVGERFAGHEQPALLVNLRDDDWWAFTVHPSVYSAGVHDIAFFWPHNYDWSTVYFP